MSEATPIASAELVESHKLISTEQYAGITSFEDALSLVQDVFGGEVVSASDLGDGFSIVENKITLIGAEMIVLSAGIYTGEIKREDGSTSEFASLRAVTKDGRKVIINDGGSGIYAQVVMLRDKKPHTFSPDGKTMVLPLYVKKGLRVSQYDHPKYGKSETYYLDTSV